VTRNSEELMNSRTKSREHETETEARATKLDYERPRVIRKRSLSRVTLFSGFGGQGSTPGAIV